MKYGARNNVNAKVKSIKKGEMMSLVKFDVTVYYVKYCIPFSPKFI